MAQIIKHRRGSIGALKDVSANVGELVMATGSIGDLNAPVLFIGESAIAGGYKPVSKIYQGASAPTLGASYGSTMDGTPFYSNNAKTLYILDRTSNIDMDLTGNIEGNVISAVTINNLTGTTANITHMSGSFTGSGIGLYDIPATGITGLNLSKIYSGSVEVKTDSVTGDIHINADDAVFVSGVTFNVNATSNLTGSVNIYGDTNVTGSLKVTGDATLEQDLYVSGNIYQTGSFYTQGNIVLSGSINIGDNLTGDTINFGGEVNSNILPTTGATYDLGSSGKTWNNVWAENANFTNITIDDITLNSLALPGDLTVSGTTILSGSVYVEDLIQGRVTLAGADGQLVDNENFTYDLANGFLLNTSGSININTSGSLNVYTHDGDDIYMSSSGDMTLDADNDITINAGDDLRMYSNDTLSLRNYSVDEPITLVTNYNGPSKTLEFDVNGNLTIPEGFTGSYLDINTQAQLASAAVEDLTDNRIVLAGVGGELEDDANFTFDGTTLKVGDGSFEVDTDGDIRTTGSLTINKIYGNTTNNNSLHLNGGDSGAPHVELESSGQISLFSEGAGSDFAINMTGSVHMSNDLNVTGSLTVIGETTFNNDLTVNGVLTVTGNTQLQANLYVSGNLEVLGSSTNVNIQSSTVEIGDNIILVNAYSPFQQYAGLAAYDSGSGGASGSLLWDSLHDYWMFVSSSGQSSKMIGTTAGTYGSENSLTDTYFPIATGPNTIGDSLLRYSGTTLSFNTNKFTIESVSGNTYIGGNVTIVDGGIDNGSLTSLITFRNDDDVLGFIDSTDTQDVTTQLLGYDETDGTLKFSSLIDGGTY